MNAFHNGYLLVNGTLNSTENQSHQYTTIYTNSLPEEGLHIRRFHRFLTKPRVSRVGLVLEEWMNHVNISSNPNTRAIFCRDRSGTSSAESAHSVMSSWLLTIQDLEPMGRQPPNRPLSTPRTFKVHSENSYYRAIIQPEQKKQWSAIYGLGTSKWLTRRISNHHCKVFTWYSPQCPCWN